MLDSSTTALNDFPDVTGYRIERLLGVGGMAEVYLATQISLNRQVALKVLSASGGAADEAIRRFEQEAQLIARLSHPHIVGIYDIGHSANGTLYYAMPYLPQGDLERHAGPLAEAEVLAMLDTLLGALEHAHAMGIIHRDLKPANILFDTQRRPLLADFGVALNVISASRVTSAGITVGSTGYMSPEQARGLPVDGRSDLYSLGAVAFELLSGRRPYPGSDAIAVAIAQWEQPIPQLPSSLSRWQPWIQRALGRRPEDRYQTAADMRAALKRIRARPTTGKLQHWWRHWQADRAALSAPTRVLPTLDPAGQIKQPRKLGRALGVSLAIGSVVVLAALLLTITRRDPTPTPIVDAIVIRHLIDVGQLWPPSQPNALEALSREPSSADEAKRFSGLRLDLIERLQQRLARAAGAHDWPNASDALAALMEATRLFAEANPATLAISAQRLQPILQKEFARAIGSGQRRSAEAALALSARLPLAPALLQMRHQVIALSELEQGFADPGGPEMRVVKAALPGHKGLAISVQPIAVTQFALFGKPDPLAAAPCQSAGSTQTCLSLDEAQRYVRWLSKTSAASYRLPSRSELQRYGKPSAGFTEFSTWTRDCQLLTVAAEQPNALTRGVRKIRSAFGGHPAQASTETHCGDPYIAKLAAPAQTQLQAARHRDGKLGLVVVRSLAREQ